MWIRIQNQRLKDASIKEYKGRGNSVSSGKYCIEMKYGNGIRYFYFDNEVEYDRALFRPDEILKVQEV